jgi:hypothetical protein
MLVRKVHYRLAAIYHSLGDQTAAQDHSKLAIQIETQLALNCGSCGESYGLGEAEPLEALPCAHILHARYVKLL